MRILAAGLLFALLAGIAAAEPPDLSKLPPHPRLWIGGVPTASGYIDAMKLGDRAKSHPDEYARLKASNHIMARALDAMISVDKAKLDGVAADLAATKVTLAELGEYALAYDWAASALSADQRMAISKNLGDRAEESLKRFNPGYPLGNYDIGAHMAAGLVALAIAEDDPRAKEIMADVDEFFTKWLEFTGDGAAADDMLGRAAYGGGWPESHDYDRHGSRYALLYFLGLRSATGVDVISKSAHWRAKPLYHIYTVLPNGRNLLPFDDDDNPFLHRFDREVMVILAREFDDPHARWYYNHVNTEKVSLSAALDFLYEEPKGREHDFTDLPKAHYIPGIGVMYARSGWGANDTYVAFRANDWFIYHENDAQNVFAIYRNAPLAVKDGVYSGEMHQQYYGYSIRTIAYNGITVLDPSEEFKGPDGFEPPAGNDGGQMIQQWRGIPRTLEDWRKGARRTSGGPMYDITDWLGFETNDKYAYAAAECGRAYSPGKVPFFSRQVLFIYPNWVIVFDRVTSGKAEFQKTFHLHAPEEMTVSGSEAVISTRKTNHTTVPGRLFVKSLLPAGGQVKRIEGLAPYAGRSWVGPDAYNDQMYCPVHLEIDAPKEKDTFFLTAMYACDATVEKAPEAKILEEAPDKVTVGLEGKWKVEFSKTGSVTWKMIE
jgi:hypothetical protein